MLNHLRSLELDDILTQAEAKKASYVRESIEEKSAEETSQSTSNAGLDFTAPSSTPNQTASFDQLQHELTSNKTTDTAAGLEFDTSSLNLSPAAPAEKAAEPELKAEPAALDFNFSVDTAPATEKTEAPTITPEPSTSATEAAQPLEFSFDLEPNKTETVAPETLASAPATTEAPSLDFDFSTTEPPAAVEAKTEPAASEFNFTFDSAPAPETTTEAETPAEIIAAPTLEQETTTAPVAATVDLNDPLVKSFPDLAQVDEIQLNLDLAAQYIELGAFDAAKALLSEQDADYSTEQRQRADQLLNQIAS